MSLNASKAKLSGRLSSEAHQKQAPVKVAMLDTLNEVT